MKKLATLILSVGMVTGIHAQVNEGTNPGISPTASSSGNNNFVYADWSLTNGQNNNVSSSATEAFAAGYNNTLTAKRTFALGTSNGVSAQNSGAFGIGNNVASPNSFALGYNNSVTSSAVYSLAIGNQTNAGGLNSFVFGNGITNSKNYSFLVGFDANEPALMVTRTGSTGPLVGVATDDPLARLDVRLGDQDEIRVQSQVANTFGSIGFKHSNGDNNWRITAYSNFPGGYGNMLGIISQGQQQSDLWIAADQTLIGDYFDLDGCSDCHEYELFVKRGIRTEKIKVDVASGTWADYVFDEDFELKPLTEVEDFISKNKHLPDVPSAKSVESEGLDLAKIDALLLQKIEELTLYVIELKKEIDVLKQ